MTHSDGATSLTIARVSNQGVLDAFLADERKNIKKIMYIHNSFRVKYDYRNKLIVTKYLAKCPSVHEVGFSQGFKCMPQTSVHWIPLTIHKNLLVISGTRYKWTFLTLMSIRHDFF